MRTLINSFKFIIRISTKRSSDSVVHSTIIPMKSESRHSSIYLIQQIFPLFLFIFHIYLFLRCRDEIDKMAKYELEHIILMLKVILADKDKCPEESDLDFYFILKDDHLNHSFYERLHNIFCHLDRNGFV